jgi:ketosteroid isomerase-like protein
MEMVTMVDTTVPGQPAPATLPPVLLRLVEATNSHDLDGLVSCFAPDYVLTMPAHPARDFVGNEQVRRNWAAFFEGIPDIRLDTGPVAVRGKEFWIEAETTGTRRDGQPHHLRGVVVFTVADDLIRACRFYLEPVEENGEGIQAAVDETVHGGSR